MTTRDDIHKIKQSLECACQNNAANLATLGDILDTLESINTTTLNANWTSIVGNSIDYTYDANNNVTVAEYFTGATLIFTQTFTYDANNNCTNITTT
jgi:hypothetical protein